jgi:hypothetical protein
VAIQIDQHLPCKRFFRSCCEFTNYLQIKKDTLRCPNFGSVGGLIIC